MKIALVHDYIKEYGGAEKVLETLHEIFPKAPIYTSVYLPKYLGPHRERFVKMDIRPSWLQRLPFKAQLLSPIRLIAPAVFSKMDFSKYDCVIVSATGAYLPNSIKKGKAVHICYCHTPHRYLYGYATARDWKKHAFFRLIAGIANHFLRMDDFTSAQNVDHFIANSKEVKARIEKFYRKDATVIYPPVDLPKLEQAPLSLKNRGYFLAGGRLARAKRPDLAIAVCSRQDIPLKVFGRGFAGYGEELKKLAGPTVEFLGEVSNEEKFKLMANARAFIFPADTEDFGITPVEAMASGTPVIAHRSGGVVESVIEGKTGIFFNELNSKSLSEAVKHFNKTINQYKPADCISQAKKFSKERFIHEIKNFVKKYA